MSIPSKILKEFGTTEEFAKFMREQINDGEQISAGKSPNDQSKEQKKEERPEDAPEPPSEGGEEPMGGEGEAGAEEPVIDPVGMPGSQVKMGGMTDKDKKDKKIENPNAVEIKLSGKKDKINKRPSMQVDMTKR